MSFADATQFWNERFDKDEFIFGKEPNEYLVEESAQSLNHRNGYKTLSTKVIKPFSFNLCNRTAVSEMTLLRKGG